MKKLKRIILAGVVALVALIAIGITLTVGWRPIIGPRMRPVTDRKFEPTAARMERGQYLVTAVTGCFVCHSEPDTSLPGAPPKAGREGAGHSEEDPDLGTVYAPNITPDKETGLGSWTDDEIARAIREGVDRDGGALFPMMPYDNYRDMPDEDLASVVVYLRSIPAVKNPVPKFSPPFPVNRLIMSAPQPITEPVANPDVSTPQARGAHLAKMGSCGHCHTPLDARGQRQENLRFAGGMVFPAGPGKQIAALNITPDASGIPYFDESIFVNFIRTGQYGARRMNPPMPWTIYRNMTDEDLKAVWAYVHSLKPVKHLVDNTLEPTECPVCNGKHGAGDMNK